jgi:hypothetical protein
MVSMNKPFKCYTLRLQRFASFYLCWHTVSLSLHAPTQSHHLSAAPTTSPSPVVFRYISTCVIMQRTRNARWPSLSHKVVKLRAGTGAGLHTASSCYWDSTLDGYSVLRVDMKT